MKSEDRLKALGQMGRNLIERATRAGMPSNQIPIACDIFQNIAGMERHGFRGMSDALKVSFVFDAETAIWKLKKAWLGHCNKCLNPRPETGLTVTCGCGGNWIAPKWADKIKETKP